ncbi:potassium/sodium hyperpolarization-activated cyclic nucleotide-gated channel 1-like [Vespula squamosa]|uniref:Potassium/sodium hyperpolarization-activated cyclic nucleotide-gated channel 1-like n=1 Tax=Vespula squamosa TaxID=30214 RepID=A0ABD2A6L0_VESSQ
MQRDRYPKATFFRVIVEYVGVNWAAVGCQMGCMGGVGLGVLSVRLAQCQLPDSENGVSACDVIGVDLSEYFNEIRGRNSAKLNREGRSLLQEKDRQRGRERERERERRTDRQTDRQREKERKRQRALETLDAQDVEHELLQVLATTSKHPSPALMRNRIRYLYLQKLFDNVRNFFMISSTNPNAQRYLRSNIAILQEKRRQIENYKNIIHPFSNFRHYWDISLIIGITIILFITPYQAAFGITQETLVPTFIKNFLLLLCCGDIFVNISTGYYDNRQSIVEMKQKKIFKRYMKHSTFFPDLFGSFPTDVIFVYMWNEYKAYINKLVFAKRMTGSYYQWFIIFFWLIIFLHWLTCIFWLVPIATTSMKQPVYPRADSWIHYTDFWYKSKEKQYFYSLLLTIGNCLRSGFLKNDQRNLPDLYVVIIAQIMGALFSCYIIAKLMEYMQGTQSSKFRYQSAICQLKQYMKHKQLPRHIQYRIINYYEFRFQRLYFRESSIMYKLSLQLRQEIIMHSCRKLVENVNFFHNLPFSILNRIIALLKSEIFLTNDVIVRANELGNCMYFIGSGTVAVYTTFGKEICHLEDGAYFGEIALVMEEKCRVASVVAVEICELYRLDRADFIRTILPYPILWDHIKKTATERHERTMILEAQ